jgi:cell division protease FtsH
MGDDTARIIDEEIRAFIDRNYERAKNILTERINILHMMADALMKYETIDATQIDALMEGREPPPPQDWIDTSDKTPKDPGEAAKSAEKKADGKIGGPAGQH